MRKGLARKIILWIAAPVFLFSTFMVLRYHLEMHNSAQKTENVAQQVVSTASQPVAEESSNSSLLETPAVQALSSAPIEVDFEELCAINPDVVAWLYCPDTLINYPVLQASDNEYYLKRLITGERNSAGSLFMDYRNSAVLSDWNTLIYGHHMKNGSMFGSLPQYKNQSYFEAHPQMFLLTPDQDYAIDVLAGFVTSADAELYDAFGANAETQKQLIQNWLDRSNFTSDIRPSLDDRLITLSTCSYEYANARYILVGILKKLNEE